LTDQPSTSDMKVRRIEEKERKNTVNTKDPSSWTREIKASHKSSGPGGKKKGKQKKKRLAEGGQIYVGRKREGAVLQEERTDGTSSTGIRKQHAL